MMPSEQAARRRYQGKVNKAQGAFFEKLIEAGCDYYRLHGVADIEKTPEPMQPIKDLGGGKFIQGGRAVNFEAKYTDTGRMSQDRVTEEQAERLERAYQYGAWAFVLCSFASVGFYRIPWGVWHDLKGHFGHKYITPQEAAPYEVRIGGSGVLLFLDHPKGEIENGKV